MHSVIAAPARRAVVHAVCAAALLATAAVPLRGQSTCDTDRSCTGNALQFPGGGFDYVDMFTTPPLVAMDSTRAMTVEFWAQFTRRPGVTQYVAGVWGPRTDRDDRWAVYIDDTDSLAFEVSDGATTFGRFDNTVVKTPAVYGVWIHVAVMWDGGTGTIALYVNGTRAATGRNGQYPATTLRTTQSYLQLGSVNGVSNDTVRLANLTGTLDEFRVWSRLLPDDELRCLSKAALTGSEAGLLLYFRCNESGGDVLCDASRFNGRGNRRGALRFVPAARTVAPTVFISPARIDLPLGCTADTVLTVTVVDTSSCAQTVSLSITGPDAAAFTPDRTTLTLVRNQTETIRIRTALRVSGVIRADIVLTPRNGCNPATTIPVTIQRTTQLTASIGAARFDTLFGCVDRQWIDTTVTLCNASGGPLALNGASLSSPAFSAVPVGWTPPLMLAPGECRDVRIRFAPPDTGVWIDTLRIASGDVCPGSGLIPLRGARILPFTSTITAANFDNPALPCRRSLNLAQEFFLRSRMPENITVEEIVFSDPAFSTPTRLPLVLRPGIATRAYIRFRSNVEGVYIDTAVVRVRVRGCLVEQRIPLRGRVVDVRLTPSDTLLAFGSVVVGRSVTLPAGVTNDGIDGRTVFAYLSSGRAFSFAGGNRFTLAPAGAQTLQVTFRPTGPGLFRDTLCFEDVGCLVKTCLVLEGTGTDGSLRFLPPTVDAAGVINCRCRLDTVWVENTTGSPVTIRSATLAGTTRFTFDTPLPVPGDVLAPGARRMYVLRYCPAGQSDGSTERGDLVLDTDGPDGTLRVLLRGTVVEPRITIDALINFGDVEAGTSLSRVLRVVNPSPVPVRVDSVGPLPAGFTVTGAVPPFGSTLGFRDTMLVTVTFAPVAAASYGGAVTARSTEPCPASAAGQLLGRGIIVPLFVPWSTVVFREASRCDSVLRVIGLVNDGSVPIRIDSIVITGANAAAFSWRGRTFTGPVPRDVPPMSADSIDLLYFPDRSPTVQSQAQVRITATTRAGTQTWVITLVGGRIRQFIPSAAGVAFPSTPVRGVAAPLQLTLQNPSWLDTLFIDSLGFAPDFGVFQLLAPAGIPPSRRVAPRQSITLRFEFRPLAARVYASRIRLVTRMGCEERDTTLTITGEGYTPPYLTRLCIDSAIVAGSGDTIRVPVTLNRPIPQNPLDISMLVRFPRRALEYLGVDPVFSTQAVDDTLRGDGVKLSSRGNWNVGAGPVLWLRFRVATWDSTVYFAQTDSISFASDSTLFIALFGDGCVTDVTVVPRCGVSRIGLSAGRYELGDPYPHPARGLVSIPFGMLEDAPVRISVVDLAGREVAVAASGPQTNGRYVAVVDVSMLASGMHRILMRASTFTASRPLLVLR